MTDTQTTHPSLLLRMRDERDADSWSKFVATYSPLVQGFLHRRGLQDADAADLTQEVLVRVATAIKRFEYSPERGSFRGWLFTIVENCLRQFSAQERPGRRGSGDTRILHALTEHPASDLQEEWDHQYQRYLLERAAHDVRGDFQAATWNAFWETAVKGRVPKKVADELGISIASVYMAKHRITERLRQHIQYLDGGQSVKPVAACPDSARLAAMLEETLSLEEQQTVQQHVDGCPACQTRLDAMLETGADVQLPLRALREDLLLAPEQPNQAISDRHDIEFAFLQPSSDSLSLGRLAHYEVLEVIGRGGMGIVFRVRDTRLQRIVAIKALAPVFSASGIARQRFLREAQAAAAVSHDHIITIYAVEPGPVPYLVMELIDGQSLQQKIEQSGHLELVEILRIGYQIASGLAAAHAQGVIHRDIKPANILLQNGIQRVQITDFGLARAADDAGSTRTGEVAGTPQYMSPEQAQGRSVDARSDLFSLGSVLYAMAAGRSPFRADSAVAVLRRVCDESQLPIREINPDVPPWLAAIIERLLAKNPDQRYQSAAEVEGLLGQHLARVQQPLLAPPVAAELSPARPNGRPLGFRRWRWAGLVLLLLLGVLGVMEATHVTNLSRNIIRAVPRGTAAAPPAAILAANRPTPRKWPTDAPPPSIVPFDRDQAAAHQRAWASYLGVPVEFTNTLGMKLRLIPPGEFVMGSPPADIAEALENREDPFYRDTVQSEAPQHDVQLSEPWFLGVYEVTQEQYEIVSGETPSYFSPQNGGQYEVTDVDTRTLPVEQVSWNQSAQFCNALSRRDGLAETYTWIGEAGTVQESSGYHLPTEAQWEFACRAGTTTRYWFAATGEQLSTYGWHQGNAAGRTHSVGQLQPNPFGFHDLNGNVSEWCQDGWQLASYAQLERHTAVNPTGPSADFFFRVLRGGNIRYQQLASRSAKRMAGGPNLMQDYIGLRVALSVDSVKTLLQAQREKASAPQKQPPGPVPRGEPP